MVQPDPFFPPPQLEQPSFPATPFVWSAQTPDDTLEFLDDLDRWLEWLTWRYRLDHRTAPTCWAQHPELIEELSALHLAWVTAFHSGANGDAPLLWHERFANARARIADWVSRTGCRPDAHRPR